MKKDSSDLLLLDVNVLLAIAWPNHQLHEAAIKALVRFSNGNGTPELGSFPATPGRPDDVPD
jgi:hypothetical protein